MTLPFKILDNTSGTTFDFSTEGENHEDIDLEIDEEYRQELKDKYNIDLDTPEGLKLYGEILSIVLEGIKNEMQQGKENGNDTI